jgi:peptidyl-prolyl cis-trans isomerase C
MQVVAREVAADSLYEGEWDWGYFTTADVLPEISRAVFAAKKGGVTRPIKTDYGYHVLKIIDKQNKGAVKSLDRVREEIRLKLETKKKQDKYQRFLLQLKSKYSIETNFQLLDSALLDSLLLAGDRSR